MKIWIMRHGEASFNAPSDEQRILTARGEEMAKSQGEWLGKQLLTQQIQFDKIIVSPYSRAKQTLEQLIVGLQAVNFPQNIANVMEEWEEITPSGNPITVVDYLHFLKEEGAKHILVVSHLPLVFDLTQLLTDNQTSPSFVPATMVEIDLSEKKGRLLVVKQP